MKFTEWLYLAEERTFDECVALEALYREYLDRHDGLNATNVAVKTVSAVGIYPVFPDYVDENPDFSRVMFFTNSDISKVKEAVKYCAVACLRGESVDDVSISAAADEAIVEFYFDSTKSRRNSPVVQWFSEFAAMMEDKFDIAIESITVWVL